MGGTFYDVLGATIIDNGVIATGNQRILIRCATHRGRRLALFTEGDEKPSVSIEICFGRNS